jgi:hypothetical protein
MLIGAIGAVAMMPAGARAAAPPRASTAEPEASASIYVHGSWIDVCGLTATTECPLFNDAAAETIPATGGMAILDFGAPCYEPATLEWGTQLFNSQSCTPAAILVTLAQAWLRGYEANPNRTASPRFVLVAGTSNSLTAAVANYTLSTAEMALHGRAWFSSVVAPIAAASQAQPTPVAVWAGDDIEQAADGNWYSAAETRAWVDAYAAASHASKPCVASRDALLVDYGDYVPNEPGWTPGDVYHVAWQSAPACPMPEIYRAANAGEWQGLNSFALGAGLPRMEFTGVLSEDGALGSLSGKASWNALRGATGQTPPFLSVIDVAGFTTPEVPDAPTAVAVEPGPGLVTVSWSAPAWDGGSAVTTYTVSILPAGAPPQVVILAGWPAAESAIVGGLANGTTYTFYVSASNRVGTGPQSPPSPGVAPSALFPMR